MRTAVSVAGVVTTPLAGVIEAADDPAAVVVAPVLVCAEVLPVLTGLVGVKAGVTGVATGKLLCVWLELLEAYELPWVEAADTVVIKNKLEHEIASTLAAIDLIRINMYSPKTFLGHL